MPHSTGSFLCEYVVVWSLGDSAAPFGGSFERKRDLIVVPSGSGDLGVADLHVDQC